MRLEGTHVPGRASRRSRASCRRQRLAAGRRVAARRASTRPRHERRGDRAVRRRDRATCRQPIGAESRTARYAMRDGRARRSAGAASRPANVPGTVAARMRGMLAVRDAVRAVFPTQLDDAPEERIVEARRQLNDIYDSFVRRLRAAVVARERQGLRGRSRPAAAALARKLRPRDQARHQDAIFERRTLERYRPVEQVETAAEALAVSLNETGEINWPRMEQVTGRTAPALAARTGQPGLPQSGRRRLGDRRPLSERQRARANWRRPERRRALDPAYRAQYRSAEGGAACRPGAGRHRGAAGLVVDSGRRTSATSLPQLLDVAPRQREGRPRRGHRDLDGRARLPARSAASATRRPTGRRAFALPT